MERKSAVEDSASSRAEQLESDLADSTLLQRLSAEMLSEQDPASLYEKIMDAAVGIMRSDFASMQMLYPERGAHGELKLLTSRGFPAEAVKSWEWVRADSSCACGYALRTGRQTVVADIPSCMFIAGTDHEATYLRAGIRAVQSTPLVTRSGTPVGMLSTHWSRPHAPSERDLRLLDVLVRQAADLIERTRTEEALRRSHETFFNLVANAPLGVYVVDRHFRIAHVSAGAQQAFRNVRPLIGHDFAAALRIIWSEPFATEAIGHFRRTLATGESYLAPSLTHARHDLGTIESYEWEIHRITMPDGTFGVVCYYYESTKIRQAEAALLEADRRKDEFLAMLAHELRNPLAAIRNAVQILLRAEDDPLTVRSVTEILNRQVGNMTRHVDDLLDVSRISRGKIELRKQRLELATIVHHAVEAVRPMCEGLVHELKVALPPNPTYVYGDPVRLAQAVENLLSNAYKFTDKGGRIWLTVEQHGERAVIRVRDRGIGIAADELSRIFEIFAQVDTSLERARAGLGLGLALVKRLVELHDGTVEARSAGLGQGSEFVITLPRLAEPLEPLPNESSNVNPVPTIARRILVVDDNRDSAHSLAMLLKLMGHDVDTAHDGLEAVGRAVTFRPDVILLDIGMPRLNGYEAARRIREQGQAGLTLVALTGWGQEEDRRRSRLAGFDAHLVKPVDLDALSKLLAE